MISWTGPAEGKAFSNPDKMAPLSIITCMLILTAICCNGDYSRASHSQARLGSTLLDTAAIYDGVMQPENIIVGIIQNFINFLTTTIGWALIMPFYQVASVLVYRVYALHLLWCRLQIHSQEWEEILVLLFQMIFHFQQSSLPGCWGIWLIVLRSITGIHSEIIMQ